MLPAPDEVLLLPRVVFEVVEELLDVPAARRVFPTDLVRRMDGVEPSLRPERTPDLRLADLNEHVPLPPHRPFVEQTEQAVSPERVGNQRSGEVKQRRRDVDEAHELRDDRTPVEPRPLRHKGDADRGIVRAALVFAVTRTEVTPMVGEEQHDGVLREAESVERSKEPAEVLVEPLDHAVVVGKFPSPVAARADEVPRDVRRITIAGGIAVRCTELFEVILLVRLDER